MSNSLVRLIDFHCHLDLYPDPASVIAAADNAGVLTLAVTTTPRAWPENRRLTEKTSHIRVALGLHPQLVAQHPREIDLWETFLPEARYVGEVGLDAGPRFYRSLPLQKEIFERILTRCAEIGDKILTVHSVRAVKDVISMIEKRLPPSRGRVVLHWFTGSKSDMKRAVDLGFYFSINHAMFSNERAKVLISEIPKDRLLTETDGPFTFISGRPAVPNDIQDIVSLLGTAHGISPNSMAQIILKNVRTLCTE